MAVMRYNLNHELRDKECKHAGGFPYHGIMPCTGERRCNMCGSILCERCGEIIDADEEAPHVCKEGGGNVHR